MSSGMAVACNVDSTVGGTSDWLSVVMMSEAARAERQHKWRLYAFPQWTTISVRKQSSCQHVNPT